MECAILIGLQGSGKSGGSMYSWLNNEGKARVPAAAIRRSLSLLAPPVTRVDR